MKFDSYPRFLKSDLYRQYLVADMEGLPLPFEEEKPDKGKLFKKVRVVKTMCCPALCFREFLK